MSTEQLLLFIAVMVLSLALLMTIAWPGFRTRFRAWLLSLGRGKSPFASPEVASPPTPDDAGGPRGTCPACRRTYDSGFRFCPVDARPLTFAGEATPLAAGLTRLTCQSCRRIFLADGGARFCPFDGKALAVGAAVEGLAPGNPMVASALAGIRSDTGGFVTKICPTCSERVENGATQCERDGTDLVPLN